MSFTLRFRFKVEIRSRSLSSSGLYFNYIDQTQGRGFDRSLQWFITDAGHGHGTSSQGDQLFLLDFYIDGGGA